MNLNKVFLIGNLTRDPELRQIPSGQALCSFGIATNRVFFDNASGQKKEDVQFHNIVAWGKQAELVHQYLQKGRLACIEGRLQTRSWQDPQGVKHWRTEIIAERVQFGPRSSEAPREGGPHAAMGEPFRGGPPVAGVASTPPPPPPVDTTPIIELPADEGEEIDVKNIPF